MRAVVQRVARARVIVGGDLVGEIGAGLLILLGVGPDDDRSRARHLAARVAALRVFPDATGRMNRSLLECGGAALVVSQFTLFADLRRGHRPSFIKAGAPDLAEGLCQEFCLALGEVGVAPVAQGRFGAHMEVESVNDGPVTLVVSSGPEAWDTDCG